MVAPTPKVRGLVLLRDESRCVACFTRTSPLEMQHRQAVGAGGSKHRPGPAELATACCVCNMRFESDRQAEALALGWKVRRWVRDPGLVPMFNKPRARWGLLTSTGGVVLVTAADAIARMREIYGPDWDRWAAEADLEVATGRTTR
jgi:hypothetical protein